MLLSFSPLQMAEYLVEKGHLQPLTNPVSRALQAYSLDLSLPVTSFCYQDSEKKSRKVDRIYRAVYIANAVENSIVYREKMGKPHFPCSYIQICVFQHSAPCIHHYVTIHFLLFPLYIILYVYKVLHSHANWKLISLPLMCVFNNRESGFILHTYI